MSTSETITKTDLTNILNEVLPTPQGAYFDLIWTNPNGNSQTSTMGDTNIDTGKTLSNYDGFMIEFRCVYNAGEKTYGFNFTGLSGMVGYIHTIKKTGNPIIEYSRFWYPISSTEIRVSDCTRILDSSTNITGQDTGCLVPIRIWGIVLKASGVTTFQTDYIVEQGTSGGWTYRKWNSGLAEAWKRTSSVTYAMTNIVGGNGYASDYWALPSGVFTSVTTANINRVDGGNGLIGFSIYSTTTSRIDHYVWVTGTTGTVTMQLGINVVGTWK